MEEIRGMIFVLLATAAERFALLKLCNKYDRIFLHISEDNIRTVQTWIYITVSYSFVFEHIQN